ncbi:hypothetical protein [Sulfurimonas sp.]|uniref:hypothetical protein n=1 Tax=Sulfurimonas sp. TaxID=2022749 RepID=UPI0019E268DD|nr:hypothetical protein [Sulfurimonas sp.]MBE0515714.1 hypothetical protein [Sulfurimonas sp.]
MVKVKIEEFESMLEDLMPDEATARTFGISNTSYGADSRLKITSVKVAEEDGLTFVGTTERFGQLFYIYQY